MEEEEREKRPEEQEAKDRIETWPDSATQVTGPLQTLTPALVLVLVYLAACLSPNSFFILRYSDE